MRFAVALGLLSSLFGEPIRPAPPVARPEGRWKINTHLFAANKALADAIDDGMVTIPPFGEIPVSASALKALKAAPASYRAGVLAPDLFPDMYVGGWFIHSDLPSEKWTADDWIRHVWTKARGWQDPAERDKVLAFAYGFLTHGTGDIFAHTYVNQKADGAWITFDGAAKSTAYKHIVLEGYIGAHTPSTDLGLDVWPRFVSNILIKDPAARRHSAGAKHYQRWLAIYDWLGPQIERAKKQMNDNVDDDAPYWLKCTTNPVACAKKEQMETWRLDINRGFRALVDSSETLGEQLMAHQAGTGVGAMTGWAKEWVPKMFGAHAIGEGAAAMQQFLDWIGDPLAPITEPFKDEVARFLKDEFPKYYELYQMVQDPATQMDNVGFPAGTRAQVNQEMGLNAGSGGFDWRVFAPIYNSVILAKLALLDGDGLNELARRAGLTTPLYQPGEDVNVMLGVFRSMTQSYQWIGDSVYSDTLAVPLRFGICGPEGGNSLPPRAPCGLGGHSPLGSTTRSKGGGGFVFYSHPAARQRIFGVIFKGFGPGPGTSVIKDVATGPVAATSAVWDGGRALRAAAEQTEVMREVVLNMRGKIAGVAPVTAVPPVQVPTTTRAPVGSRPTARPGAATPTGTAAAGAIVNWGQRCCAADIAELRAALGRLQSIGARLQNPAVLSALARRPPVSQLAGYAVQLAAALDAFANTRDAQTAAASLDAFARQIEGLTRLVAGTQ